MLQESQTLVVSRQMLGELGERLSSSAAAAAGAALTLDKIKNVAEFAIEHMQPRVVSFEEQASIIRVALADVLQAEEDWRGAAAVLNGVPLDTGHRWVQGRMASPRSRPLHLSGRMPRPWSASSHNIPACFNPIFLLIFFARAGMSMSTSS